jgi:molybdopterin-guanine dinucleotide biosynthesis protein A
MELSAYILAGGKSSRFGTDKGLALVEGKSMLEHVYNATFKAGINSIWIVGRESVAGHPSYRCIPDSTIEKGPLGGIMTVMEHTKSDHMLILSCDMPFIHSAIVSEFIQACDWKYDACVARIGNDDQPLFGVYSKRVLPQIQALLSSNRLSMRTLLEEISVRYLDVDKFVSFEERTFANINTREDLKRWEKK